MSNEPSESGESNSTFQSSREWSEHGVDKPPVVLPPLPPEPPPPPVWETPEPSEAAKAFLDGIDPDLDYKYLMFDDSLITSSDREERIGEFSISIKPTVRNQVEYILIEANSHGAMDGVPCGTSITCVVDKKLNTVEQQHHEYVKLPRCPLDRRTTIVRELDASYLVTRQVRQGAEQQDMTKWIPADEMVGFMSEGSNLLLHRLMIRKVHFEDSIRMLALDSELNICPAVYAKLLERMQTIEGEEVLTYGISRTITSPTDLPTTWQSYFMTDGHLAHRVQVGSPVTMKLCMIPKYMESVEEPPKPTFEKKPLDWRKDEQLYSMYLQKVEELKADSHSYLRRHPELHDIIFDFLQFLLLRKPDDILKFAAEYFITFKTEERRQPPYLTSDTPDRFPDIRTNTRIKQLRIASDWAPKFLIHGCTSEELANLKAPKPLPNFLW